MCGRFSLTSDEQGFSDRFNFRGQGIGYAPREEIRPTDPVLAVVQNGPERLGVMMYWGFLPFWGNGKPLINAQAERLAASNVWREPFRERRCLVLADGFFEWRKNPDGTKTMVRLALKSREPFAMAGLWGEFRNKKGQTVPCAAIVTTAPNELVLPIHNRMPVMLTPESEALWLDPMSHDPRVLSRVLVPYQAAAMTAREYQSRPGAWPELFL